MSALDFSHFKKTAQDKKIATLMHPDGHSIKIAIANLKPELRKKLEAMPLHQADPKGVVEKPSKKEPLDDNSPAEADVPDALEEGASEEVAATPPEAAAPTQPAVAQAPEAPVAAPAPQAAPAATQEASPQPEAAPTETAQEAPEQTPEQIAADRNRHDGLFANDLQAGHIKPKTYGELFAEKSTLGKIGTLFGLIVAGAGAGLTHTPNVIISMMDKQIQNDLEAQKADQSNRQNWAKIGVDYTKSQVENALTNSETAKNWTQNEMDRFMNDKAGIIKSMGFIQAENSMMTAAIQSQQDAVNKMAQGPARDQAQNNLNNVIIPATLKKIQENNSKAGVLQSEMMKDSKNYGSNTKSNLPPEKGFADPNKDYDVIDQNELDNRISLTKKFGEQKGALMDSKSIPVAHGDAITKEAGEMRLNRANKAEDIKTFQALQALKNKGQLPLNEFMAEAGKIFGGLLGKEKLGELLGKGGEKTVKGVYGRIRNSLMSNAIAREAKRGQQTEAQLHNWAEDSFPGFYDDPKSEKVAWDQLNAHHDKDPTEEKADYTRRYGLYKKPPQYAFSPSKGTNSLQDVGTAISGVTGGDGTATAGEDGDPKNPGDDVVKGNKNQPDLGDSLSDAGKKLWNAISSKNKKGSK